MAGNGGRLGVLWGSAGLGTLESGVGNEWAVMPQTWLARSDVFPELSTALKAVARQAAGLCPSWHHGCTYRGGRVNQG